MKRYRLLVDWNVVLQLRDLPARSQREVFRIFTRLEDCPDLVSEFQTTDTKGRELEAFVCADYAFYYWIDFADRHVKVLSMEPADRRKA